MPRDAHEKIEDAATVARYTGIAKTVALHIPWDAVNDYAGLAAFAAERGIRIGGINSNTFQDEDYKLGSLTHPSAAVRRKAIDAIVGCCDIARETGSDIVKVWLSDGTNYPGQDDFRARRRRLIESLREVYAALPDNARMVLEYKLYEPAFYHTDVQDWGQSLSVCQHLGERAQVCVDTGHHAMAVNIEQIVAILLQEGRLGAFDLNDKKYGDDDLMVGSIDPYQLFRIFHELVGAARDEADPVARATAARVVYMLDQCHNIEPKIPAMIRSVMTLRRPSPGRCSSTRRRCARRRTRATSSRRTGSCRTRSRSTSGPPSRNFASRRASMPTRIEPTWRAARPRPGPLPARAASRRGGADRRQPLPRRSSRPSHERAGPTTGSGARVDVDLGTRACPLRPFAREDGADLVEADRRGDQRPRVDGARGVGLDGGRKAGRGGEDADSGHVLEREHARVDEAGAAREADVDEPACRLDDVEGQRGQVDRVRGVDDGVEGAVGQRVPRPEVGEPEACRRTPTRPPWGP